MPKIVNHEEKKSQIAEAVWRVIINQGMEGVTVRNIAREAGISLGALRHYFSTQDELLLYTMNLVKEKAAERIQEITVRDLPPKAKVLSILYEIVPLNKITMAEMEVWFTFIFYFRHNEEFHRIVNEEIFLGIQRLIDYLDRVRLLRRGLDKDLETERLYALVDGIALHAMLEKERLNKERIIKVLTYHIDSICMDEEG